MMLSKFRQTYNTLVSENNFYRLIISILLLLLFIAMVGWISNDKATVLIPPTLNEKAEVSNKAASATYKKAWAMYISGLLGNVTPGNADFVFESIQPMLAPDVYFNVTNGMRQEVSVMKRDSVSVQFQPRTISHEAQTNKCFVSGRTNIIASTGQISSFDRTYEIEVTIKSGTPVITYLDSYTGQPRTKDIVERLRQSDKQKEMQQKAIESKKQSEINREVEALKAQQNPEEQISN